MSKVYLFLWVIHGFWLGRGWGRPARCGTQQGCGGFISIIHSYFHFGHLLACIFYIVDIMVYYSTSRNCGRFCCWVLKLITQANNI
ncbi:hypothetical protein BZA77DRAFT_65046 [Pyronema omphalodes]|nr:hypothetical protein BZA77DRAFT_65046 [Pyronema omphalodes]